MERRGSWVVGAAMVVAVAAMVGMRGAEGAAQSCDGGGSCLAMVGYRASVNAGLAEIAALFSVNYTSVLGANDVDPSLWDGGQDVVVAAGAGPYLVPQTCGCVDGSRVVTGLIYTVVKGDTLSAIAARFSNFVTYTQIAQVSNISNPDLIQIGQKVVIPIPCACVSGQQAISLSYQLQTGDTLSAVASSYNTTTQQLELLNSISAANVSQLQAGQLLFVPLSVCKANFSSGAADGNLTVVEGTYELTANNCVQCNCNNGTLHCVPAPSSPFGSNCSKLTCSNSSLALGASNASQGSQECLVESCIYKGFTVQSGIMSSLEPSEDPTCPAAQPPEAYYKPPTGLVAAPLSSSHGSSPTISSPTPASRAIASPPTSSPVGSSSVSSVVRGISCLSFWCFLISTFLVQRCPLPN